MQGRTVQNFFLLLNSFFAALFMREVVWQCKKSLMVRVTTVATGYVSKAVLLTIMCLCLPKARDESF